MPTTALEETPVAGGPSSQPKFRMKNPEHALSVIHSAADRIKFQIEQDAEVWRDYDRIPPLDPYELEKSGEPWRTNVNFGDGENAINEKTEALVNLMTMPSPLVDFTVKSREADPITIDKLNKVALEYDYLLQNDPMWVNESHDMCINMVGTGLGIIYHPDPYSWHFESIPRCNLIYPVKAGLNPNKWDWVAIRKEINIVDLIKKLDPDESDAAKSMGWDIGKVRKLITSMKDWTCVTGGVGPGIDTDPEAYIEGLLENDLYFAAKNGHTVSGFSFYVQEFDGKVTEHILVDDAKTGFIYSSKHRYDTMSDFIYLFPLTLGKKYLEKVRGLGHRMLPFNALMNDLKGRTIDLTVVQSSLMLKGGKPDATNDLEQVKLGDIVTVIPEDFALEQRALNNPSQGLIALEQSLRGQREANKRVFGGGSGETKEITATHARLKYAEETRSSGYETDRFYVQLTQFHRGVWNRLKRFADEGDAMPPCNGKKEAEEFWKELKKLEISKMHLDKIRTVKANSVFGDGDPAQVFLALQDLLPMMPQLPMSAQRQALKLMIASRTRKPQLAEEWLPTIGGTDTVKSEQNWRVSVENDSFENGSPMPIRDDDVTAFHAQLHTEYAEGVVTSFEQGVLPPEEALKPLILCRDHTSEHMANLSRSSLDRPLFADLNKRWQGIINMIVRMEQMVAEKQEAERQKQLEELRNPSLTVKQREEMMTGEFQRNQIAQTQQFMRDQIAQTEETKREALRRKILTENQLKAIELVPNLDAQIAAIATAPTPTAPTT